MEPHEIFTLVIALGGFGLSTYHEIRNNINEKKRIKITFIHVLWEERYKISIVNSGKRPISIRDISGNICWDDEYQWESIPHDALFSNVIEFPIFFI